jgi:Domain of unknown function (DUF4265)
MADKPRKVLINVYAGSSAGKPVYEELPAVEVMPSTYRLLSSPGLALNMAKNDLIAIPVHDQPAQVLERGGNFCIHIYADAISSEEHSALEQDVERVLGGSVDGIFEGNMSISVPATAGMERIREFFDTFTERTGKQWFYANIYKNFEDIDDETLLNWWSQSQTNIETKPN